MRARKIGRQRQGKENAYNRSKGRVNRFPGAKGEGSELHARVSTG